ncbi:ATP-binding cassette (ABC) Superfamily [Phytophthora palmivora]|uniref:ATP-binding cassette (ABC) Superfamily n=1 Tax=Phytophthora palmivora TaxID=4796 RepID=A0A2P4Y7T5_9STRA|nr:ATP-binding cassette (ABC) Superfamily [Phytophthora palmivora]
MMKTGNKRQLNLDDLWELESENRSVNAFADFEKHYNRHDKSIIKAIVTTYGSGFALFELSSLFSTGCDLFAAVVLKHVITAFAAPEIDMYSLCLWFGVFFTSRLMEAIFSTHARYHVDIVTLRLKAALKALLFRKSMRCNKNNDDELEISNLVSSDIGNVIWAGYVINSVWTIPIQIVVVVYMLYTVIDVAAFAGLAVIAISLIATSVITKYSGNTFEDVMMYKDTRMKTIKEVFNAIHVVKLNAWEGKFADKIKKLRATELSAVKRYMYLSAAETFLMWVSPVAVSTVSFAVYALVMEKTLTAAKVFTAIALFDALNEPLEELPSAIQACIEAKVSINRFSNYLA